MKKLFFALMLLLCITCVKAEETTKLDVKWIPNVYFNYKKDNLTYWGQSGYLYIDGKIAYCLELEQSINTDTYTYSEEIMNNNLVILAGYFGYGYNNEINVKDYLATQKLIWHFLGTDVYFTTKSKGEGDIIDVRDYEIKITSRINKYALFPKIERNFVFDYGSTNVINDTNNVISKMDVINSSGNNIYIDTDNNNLIFNANEVGKNNFYLSTKYISNYKNQILVANNSQKIMVIGEVNNIKAKYNYEVTGGSIEINVTTFWDNVDLSDNRFELYDSNNVLIGTYNASSDGKIYINNLKYDHYVLKHVNITTGYVSDIKEYDLYLTNENRNITQDISINPLRLIININKTYGNKKLNYIKGDSNIIYNIYNKNEEFLYSIVTDENGNCSGQLYYGDYIIKQMNSSNEIIHDDIIISKSDFTEDNKLFEIYDEINNFILRVTGKDTDTNEIVNNFNFKIGDNEYEKNNEVININLEYGNYYINNINLDGYEKVEDFYLDVNENSDFYIENDELILDLCIEFKKIPVIEVVEEPIIIEPTIEEPIIPSDNVDNNKINEEGNEDKKEEQKEDREEQTTVKEEQKEGREEQTTVKEEKKVENVEKEEKRIELDDTENKNPIINEINKDNEIANVEKLPNLGVYYEKYTIFNIIYIFIIFSMYRLFKYRNN